MVALGKINVLQLTSRLIGLFSLIGLLVPLGALCQPTPVPPAALTEIVRAPRQSAGGHTVSWNFPVSDEYFYALYRRHNEGAWVRLARVPPASSRVEGVSEDGTYTYRIHQCYWDGDSFDDCAAHPVGRPAFVDVLYVGVPSNLDLPTIDHTGHYDVSWGPASGDRPATYQLWERKKSESWRLVATVPDAAADANGRMLISFTDKDNATWSYRVNACNSRGNCGLDIPQRSQSKFCERHRHQKTSDCCRHRMRAENSLSLGIPPDGSNSYRIEVFRILRIRKSGR